jgi:hypothetical protein
MLSFEDYLCRAVVAFLLVRSPVYTLSSGPVLGFSLWLYDVTKWDGFYAVIFLYLPLLELADGSPFAAYIEFWVGHVFDSSFPG